MADSRGFLKYDRENSDYRPIQERVNDWNHVQVDSASEKTQKQAARCMDCGVPFCNQGCPLGNLIPDWNDLVYRDKWEEALDRLHSTNNFPEFTGMVCPAPCEQACVLGINQEPVTIKQVEWELVRVGWDRGWIKPAPPKQLTDRNVAVIGSGPAGLSGAQQLMRAGHHVTVFEKADRIGGLLRYGIPDFKLEKWLIDRRIEQMRDEGVTFVTNVNVGIDFTVPELRKKFDAVLLAIGSEIPRALEVPGSELRGVHYAMDFLVQQNRRVSGETIQGQSPIFAEGKNVLILGGGDTGSDCIGTSHRQGAASVTSIELLPRPPEGRHFSEPWPLPKKIYFNVSSSHAEGGVRDYARMTTRLRGINDRVVQLDGIEVEFDRDHLGRPLMETMREVSGSDFSIPADLVLLAMGFVHPNSHGLIEDLGVNLGPQGSVKAGVSDFMTTEDGVFAAGDCRRGQSLVVWAQWEGREAARSIDAYLMGRSYLQSRTSSYRSANVA